MSFFERASDGVGSLLDCTEDRAGPEPWALSLGP